MPIVIEDASAGPHDWAARGLTIAARWSGPPARDDVRSALREVPDDGLLVCGGIATLSIVLDGLRRAGRVAETPVAFIAGDRPSPATLDLVESLSLPTDPDIALGSAPAELLLARTEIGGVLLAEAVLTPLTGRGFGAQAYHDDELIADGVIGSLSVRPDYSPGGELRATVVPVSGRKRSVGSSGRAVQVACDPVSCVVDDRAAEQIEGRTWYVDEREHWLLRGALPALRAAAAPLPAHSGLWARLTGRR